MDEQNIFVTLSQDIPANLTVDEQTKLVSEYLSNVIGTAIYSYIVHKCYKDDAFVTWRIKYNISQIPIYNTFDHNTVISEVRKIFIDTVSEKQKIVGYHQPDIVLMLKLFDPIVRRLAVEQSDRWNKIEYEDAYSMCRLCMFELYQKGYYIHKDLLRKSFNNKILMSLRSVKDEPFIVSFENLIVHDEDVSFADILEDKETIYQQEDAEEQEELMCLFNKVKAFCIDIMGKRQFEQLFNEYANKRTTMWSRKKMQDLKRMFTKHGITIKNFKE